MKISRRRRIRAKIEAGERAVGVAVQLPSPETVEIAGQVGLDYAWLDAEHGPLDLSELRELIRAADAVGLDSVVRVADHQPSFIQRVLDLGATGIMVPHIRRVDEAPSAASAVRYSPTGLRGACPSVRSVGHVTVDWVSDYTRADADVLVFGLIEDLESIASHGGLDGLVFGPFDLGMVNSVNASTRMRGRSDLMAAITPRTGAPTAA